MKSWLAVILILGLASVCSPVFAAQKSGSTVPKYDPSTEITLKGNVDEVRDRECAVSAGLGSHVILRTSDDKTIEVHLASTKFVKAYDLVFAKGDKLEVTGSKVTFEGVETIFAREVKRGNDTFVFRDKEGNPVW